MVLDEVARAQEALLCILFCTLLGCLCFAFLQTLGCLPFLVEQSKSSIFSCFSFALPLLLREYLLLFVIGQQSNLVLALDNFLPSSTLPVSLDLICLLRFLLSVRKV